MKCLPIIFILFISCQQQNKTFDESLIDTTGKQEIKDSLLNVTATNSLFSDSVNADKAPVKILHADPVTNESSNYRSIKLTYENVSGKNITGIKFKWHGVNAFNDPAQMGGQYAGIGTGFTDDPVGVKELKVSIFDISSNDLKKVVRAWVYEVAFQDGTKWKASN